MEINNLVAQNNSHIYYSDMEKDNRFADSLRKLRTWKGISQKELGDELDVTDTTVSAWENHSLDRVPPKPMIDMLTKFFDKELKETKINLYEDAGVYSSLEVKTIITPLEQRMDRLEKKIDILLNANKADKNV